MGDFIMNGELPSERKISFPLKVIPLFHFMREYE